MAAASTEGAVPDYNLCFLQTLRFKTFISTDKPIYRPGETVWVRGTLLNPHTLRTLNSGAPANWYATLKVIGPSKAVVSETKLAGFPSNSVMWSKWDIPMGTAGGDYTVQISHLTNGFLDGERTFSIREFTNPRMRLQLEFKTKGLGVGDAARALLEVARAEGGIPAGAKVTSTARIDNAEVWRNETTLDASGALMVEFTLPPVISRGEGSLTCTVEDDGVVESTSQTIPIILKAMDIKVYPEGGALVAGLACGVYIEAFTPYGDPADLAGEIHAANEPNGPALATIRTSHEGRGKGSFTPQPGVSYQLKVIEPTGILLPTPLPAAQPSGVALRAAYDVFPARGAVVVTVAATQGGVYRVGLYNKEELETDAIVELEPHQVVEVALMPRSTTFGTLRVSVLHMLTNADGVVASEVPVAERLVFREQPNSIKVHVAKKNMYAPGEQASLTLTVTDALTGAPLPKMILGVTISDDTVLQMVQRRKQAPRLPVQALLEHEVKHIEDCQTYLEGTTLANQALDLLLGTQGWRTFAYFQIHSFLTKELTPDYSALAKRVLGIDPAWLTPREIPMPAKPNKPTLNVRKSGFGTRTSSSSFQYGHGGEGGVDRSRSGGGPPTGGRGRGGAPSAELAVLNKSSSVGKGFGGGGGAPPPAPGGAPPRGGGPPMAARMAPAPRGGGGGAPPPAPSRSLSLAPSPKAAPAPSRPAMAPAPPPAAASAPPPAPLASGPPQAKEKKMAAPTSSSDVAPRLSSLSSMPAGCMAPDAEMSRRRKISPKLKEAELMMSDLAPAAVAPSTVHAQRVYAHRHIATAQGVRNDFTDTVYWTAGLGTDENGQLVITFDTSDSITSFRVMVDAYSYLHPLPYLGSSDAFIKNISPMYLEFRMPPEVTVGDHMMIPVILGNMTTSDLEINIGYRQKGYRGLELPQGDGTGSPGAQGFFERMARKAAKRNEKTNVGSLINKFNRLCFSDPPPHDPYSRITANAPATSRMRYMLQADVKYTAGPGAVPWYISNETVINLQAVATGVGLRDDVERSLRLVPSGFPINLHASGTCAGNSQSEAHSFAIDKDAKPETLSSQLSLYRSPSSTLESSVQSLVREPHGCFEQTSSTLYPMVMAVLFLRQRGTLTQEFYNSSLNKIAGGYKRCSGYEVKGGGFEWFGHAPASEALTAMGLMQFMTINQVMPIDQPQFARCRKWLLSRLNPNGHFAKSRQSDHLSHAPEATTDAYITWALSEAGVRPDEIVHAINNLINTINTSSDTYVRGLTANALCNLGYTTEGRTVAEQLAQMQHESGQITGAVHSITNEARWDTSAVNLEALSLAILAWMRFPEFATHAYRGVCYINSIRRGGGWGNTQTTVMCLRALLAYYTVHVPPLTPSTVSVLLNGNVIETLALDANGGSATVELSPHLAAGTSYVLQLQQNGGDAIPYSVGVNYTSLMPASSDNCAVALSTVLTSEFVEEGEATEIRVTVTNRHADYALPMTLATVGVPAGLEVRQDQLKELVKAKTIDFYEVRGREVSFYWRYMEPGQSVAFNMDCIGKFPGLYTGPASRAYLYYVTGDKSWQEGLTVAVNAKLDNVAE